MNLLDNIYNYEATNEYGTPTPRYLSMILNIPIEEIKRELNLLEEQKLIIFRHKEHDGSYIESTKHYIDRLGINYYRIHILKEETTIKRKIK